MYYPDEIIEEIRSSNDIVDVIGSSIKLQKKGSNYFGLCPFHNEKSPSFSVSGQKQMFHCFGCHEGGNVITFVMKYENYTFQEAVQFLADRAGIKLPEAEETEESRKRDSLRKQLYEVNKETGRFYYYQLRGERGANALKYLKDRALSEETINRFGLGFSIPGRNVLHKYLHDKGFEDSVLTKSGLFNYDERYGMQDKFWNRVIFPIMDANNKIIAFGGRVMGEGSPKYLNSPETILFDKGRNLYGLNLARSSRKKNIIICEGYMDTIALHQAGFNQAVASLGTAMTASHANLLKRYTDSVLLCFDSDNAGIEAALRGIRICNEAGLGCRVINLSPYKDPDEFIKNLGNEEFEKRLEDAENSFYFEIRTEEKKFDMKDPTELTRFFNVIAAKLCRFEDALERDNYLEGIARLYRVNPESLRQLVNKTIIKREGITVYDRPVKTHQIRKEEDSSQVKIQKHLLTWMSDDRNIYLLASKYIRTDDFEEGLLRKVAEMFFEQLKNGEVNPASIINHFTEEEQQREIASIFHAPLVSIESKADEDKALKDIILHMVSATAGRKPKDGVSPSREEFEEMINNRKRLESVTKQLASVTLIRDK